MLGGAAVEDIISQGDDRPPRGIRPRLLVAAALVVVVALVIVEHLPHGHRAPPRANPVAGGTSARQWSSSVGLRVHGRAVLIPNGIVGNVVSWTDYTRLPRAGTRPDWFWPAMGRVAPILGLPPDRFGYVFTRLDGGWAIQPDLPGSAGCAGCAPAAPWPGPSGCGICVGSPTPVYYLADRAQRTIMLGTASLVAPAAVKGRMWLTTYPPGSDLSSAQGIAQQYNGSGARIGARVTLPAGYGITQGTPRGLLLGSLRLAGTVNTVRLWSPATGKVTRTFNGVVAVSATQIAFEPPCGATCPVHVLDLINGYEAVLALPIATTVTAGRFSPDGRYLALQVSVGNSLSGRSAIQLEVAAMPGGQPIAVPNTLVSSDALTGFGWPDNGDDLVTEFNFATRVQVALWAPGGPNLAVADLKPNQDPAALVVG